LLARVARVAAFAKSLGVRRLAANPSLLTAVLLVDRTHGNLPERRVDAYKAVTDALGRTWRANQGVPEAELPDERRLTQWLTRLADWMHDCRPEGSAKLGDLLGVLGPLWAKLQRQDWDESALDAADPAGTDVGRGILEFVEQVEQHAGLLVERAPRRWGFPHLTFEEFYAGRALVFEGRTSTRAAQIRQRLHDPRYDEPILLALGLIGRDYPEEIEGSSRPPCSPAARRSPAWAWAPATSRTSWAAIFASRCARWPTTSPRTGTVRRAAQPRSRRSARPRCLAKYTAYRNALLERIDALSPVSAEPAFPSCSPSA
jgi:hypothetical protein